MRKIEIPFRAVGVYAVTYADGEVRTRIISSEWVPWMLKHRGVLIRAPSISSPIRPVLELAASAVDTASLVVAASVVAASVALAASVVAALVLVAVDAFVALALELAVLALVGGAPPWFEVGSGVGMSLSMQAPTAAIATRHAAPAAR